MLQAIRPRNENLVAGLDAETFHSGYNAVLGLGYVLVR